MRLFKRRLKPEKFGYYAVEIKYTVIVMAENEIQAANKTADVRNDFYEATHKYIGKFQIYGEPTKARRLR